MPRSLSEQPFGSSWSLTNTVLFLYFFNMKYIFSFHWLRVEGKDADTEFRATWGEPTEQKILWNGRCSKNGCSKTEGSKTRWNTNLQYIFGRNFYIKYVTIEINISTYFRNIKKCSCTKRVFLKSFYDHYCSLPIMLFEFNGSTDHIQCVNIFRFIMCSMVLPQATEIKNNLYGHLK